MAKDKGATQDEASADGQAQPDLIANASTSKTAASSQPRINQALDAQSKEAYSRLIATAYCLAVEVKPLSSFKLLVKILKKNNVPLITKCDNSDAASKFIKEIDKAINTKLKMVLDSANFFSILSDGSQPRKTGSEKELVYIRVVKDGAPTYLCVALENIDDYGHATADNLKRAIDQVFLEKIGISKSDYQKKLVSCTADGASVNFGVYSGLLTQMSADDRSWLLKIHCVCHRVELAFGKALMNVKEFADVRQFMISLFYVCKKSGKFKRQIRVTADARDVTVYNFPKVHGTRFVNHQLKGLEKLLNNWLVLLAAIEDITVSTQASKVNPKLPGLKKKLLDFDFLWHCCLYKEILDVFSEVSLKFEKNQLLVSEIALAIDKADSRLNDILEADQDPETLIQSLAGITLTSSNQSDQMTQMTKRMLKPNHMKRLEENREYTEASFTGKLTRGRNRGCNTSIKDLKEAAIPALRKHMSERFDSFSSNEFSSMLWINPANWDLDNREAEFPLMDQFVSIFETLLTNASFNVNKYKREWKDLRMTHKRLYSTHSALAFWQSILKNRRGEFPNIAIMVELALSVGASNSVVESGFSRLTTMLTVKRLSMSHDTMERCLRISINDSQWSEAERTWIHNQALSTFEETKRKRRMEAQEEAAEKRPRTCESVDLSSSSDNDEDDPDDDDFLIEDEDLF